MNSEDMSMVKNLFKGEHTMQEIRIQLSNPTRKNLQQKMKDEKAKGNQKMIHRFLIVLAVSDGFSFECNLFA